mmetsp:Transcript_28588/g.90162  ORF Transcript_28588/g.90162 Transcript_28588/m.90162 type:complete len:276 (-) Transcript_28588:198-1025(-)
MVAELLDVWVDGARVRTRRCSTGRGTRGGQPCWHRRKLWHGQPCSQRLWWQGWNRRQRWQRRRGAAARWWRTAALVHDLLHELLPDLQLLGGPADGDLPRHAVGELLVNLNGTPRLLLQLFDGLSALPYDQANQALRAIQHNLAVRTQRRSHAAEAAWCSGASSQEPRQHQREVGRHAWWCLPHARDARDAGGGWHKHRNAGRLRWPGGPDWHRGQAERRCEPRERARHHGLQQVQCVGRRGCCQRQVRQHLLRRRIRQRWRQCRNRPQHWRKLR